MHTPNDEQEDEYARLHRLVIKKFDELFLRGMVKEFDNFMLTLYEAVEDNKITAHQYSSLKRMVTRKKNNYNTSRIFSERNITLERIKCVHRRN